MKDQAGSVVRLAKPLRAWLQRFALLSLIGAAFALMLLGKADSLLLERVRSAVVDTVTPILNAASKPVATVKGVIQGAQELAELRAENAELRARNERLMHWQMVARRLEVENESLRGLLELIPDPLETAITARVVADPGGAFVRSVLVNAGTRDGLQRGQAALTGMGLAGRVAQVGQRSARILLITDMNSRVPVMVGAHRERALLAGDNSDRPRIDFLRPRVVVLPGDRVLTSGHGGVLPAGLPIGEVISVGETGVKVEPYVDVHRLEFLRILDYEMPGLLQPVQGGQ